MARKTKLESRKTRHHSLRKRITGTTERPRLVVFRSSRHIYAQIVDDLAGKTLVAAGDLGKKKAPGASADEGNKTDRAKKVGIQLAKLCLEKGISKVVQAKVDKNRVILTSADRDVLGQTAAKVRELRPPEPYKGKGVKYAEEVIKKKAGKAGATGGGSGAG